MTPRSLAIILALATAAGCADTQHVCTSGEERPYMAIAVEYWSSRGYPVVLANEPDRSECTIWTAITDTHSPRMKGGWGEALAAHTMTDYGFGQTPSAVYPSIIRFRASRWADLNDDQRIFTATHELGHTWHDHWDEYPMQTYAPTRREIGRWVKAEGLGL